MFEARWFNCEEPELMLRYMLGKTGDRKFRLFACACVRRIWSWLRDERSRLAVQMAEDYADKPMGHARLSTVRAAARSAGESLDAAVRRGELEDGGTIVWAARAAEATVQDTGWDVARNAATSVLLASNGSGPKERRVQCELLRDAFGNPFRRIQIDPTWLRWHGGCVGTMARTIYEERRFEEMPILADALEEAGCDDEEILWHCRVDAQHARGCWLLDALLGRRQ